MSVLLASLTGLVVWQFHFVYVGVAANFYHNGLIIAVFLFGVALATVKLLSLYNDAKAIGALKETFKDLRDHEIETPDQKVERFTKALTPGFVFKRSHILGHVYDLCVEELLRTRSMKVSVGTMQEVLHAVEQSIARERSVLNYLSGLLVLLGLIGTFIGLMEMVASVGGIIGGVANSDSGSQDAVKGLLHDLEAPLVGMATGFSASLFGLFGSLVIGLAARFLSDAAHAVKEEFEDWLASVAQIEKTLSGGGPIVDDTGLGAMASAIVNVFRSTQGALDRSSEVIRKLAEKQDRQTDVLSRTLEHIEQLGLQQLKNADKLHGLDQIRTAVIELRSEMSELGRLQEARFTESTSRLGDLIETKSNLLGDGLRDVVDRQREISRATRSLEAQSATGFARATHLLEVNQKVQAEGLNDIVESQSELGALMRETAQRINSDQIGAAIGATVEARFSFAMTEVVKSLDSAFERLAVSLNVVADTQSDLRSAVQGGSGTDRNEMRALGQSIENGMAMGFAEVARSIDSVFAGYADFVRRERLAGDERPATANEVADATALAPTKDDKRDLSQGDAFRDIENRLRPQIVASKN